MGGATPGLGYVRKQGEHTIKSKTANTGSLWALLQLLVAGFVPA